MSTNKIKKGRSFWEEMSPRHLEGKQKKIEQMLKEVVRDGNLIWKLKCPKCGVWGQIDDDQLNGRVSVLCDCGFHETAKWMDKIEGLKINV